MRTYKYKCTGSHQNSAVKHGWARVLILPTTRAWRNRFVALSLPRLRDSVICKITLRTFSRISKRDLQNTQTALLLAVCTPTIMLDHRTTNKKKCVVMCVKNSVCVYFSLILLLYLLLYLRLTEFYYASLACVGILLRFSVATYLQNQ